MKATATEVMAFAEKCMNLDIENLNLLKIQANTLIARQALMDALNAQNTAKQNAAT